jgi:hypothetical protein
MNNLLKNVLEKYEPQSPDEKRFMEKHTDNTVKFDDPAGNGDEVFKASNVPHYKRSKDKMGYEEGEDEEVYEETDEYLEKIVQEATEDFYDECDEEERQILEDWTDEDFSELIDEILMEQDDEEDDEEDDDEDDEDDEDEDEDEDEECD